MPLPPGVSERDFASALEEFRRVVGDAWVFSSDADLDLYRDAYSPLRGEDEDPVPSAAVAPKATEQVQEVVRIEEVAVDKGGILHVLRMRIDSPALFERDEFGVGFEGAGHM